MKTATFLSIFTSIFALTTAAPANLTRRDTGSCTDKHLPLEWAYNIGVRITQETQSMSSRNTLLRLYLNGNSGKLLRQFLTVPSPPRLQQNVH
jgi:hypothetical protein